MKSRSMVNEFTLYFSESKGVSLVAKEEAETNLKLVNNSSSLPALPNLLSKQPDFRNVVSIGAIDTAAKRFLLIGGVEGFIRKMEEKRAVLDAKCFTQILPLIEPREEAELELLDLMARKGVEADTGFFNNLIKVCSKGFK